MSKFLKLILFLLLMFSFISQSFALDGTLSLDKDQSDINDYINLKISIQSGDGGDISITNVKGLENFDIISQSQSQSSASNIVIVNGKTQTETKTTNNLNLTLKAKNKGDFVIGPATLQNGTDSAETNSIKVKIDGDALFVNNNHLQIPTNSQNSALNNGNSNINKKQIGNNSDFDEIEKRDFHKNNELYLILGILLVGGIGFYFISKNKETSPQPSPQGEGEATKIEDFEEKKIEIKYPELTDTNFITKISEVLKNKIQLKHKIKNIENKTFEEIINELPENEKDEIKEITKLLLKAKYSNMIGDNSKILELVKKIN